MKNLPVLVVGVIAIIIMGLFAIASDTARGPSPQACTEEAMICPDGSAVGRTGPNCEFAPCPMATSPTTTTVSHECNQDGFRCPDGTMVGRTGPDCHFAPCPSSAATSTTLHTTIGQKVSGLNISITPREVTEDSRCPVDVQCIWAGTVKIRATLEDALGTSDEVFGLDTPVTTEAEEITLVEVTPGKAEGETISASSYRFVFDVHKR